MYLMRSIALTEKCRAGISIRHYLLSKQIAMCASASQGQDKDIVLNAVNKQPIGQNVAFPMSDSIICKGMVFVLLRQGYSVRKACYNLFQ